jgi:hypothetical protein
MPKTKDGGWRIDDREVKVPTKKGGIVMNRQMKYPKNTKVIIVESDDERQRQIYGQYENHIGKRGIVIGIGAIMEDLPGGSVLEKPIYLYEIDTGADKTILIPEEMIRPIEK